jgi:hypothetical protein
MSDDAAVISRYLLHELPASEREAIERRYLSDPDYLELIEAVEGDLIDAYVRGELSHAQRERFERYFLCTRSRQERVRLAEALIEKVPSRRSWTRERIALAASLLVLAGLAAGMWPRESRVRAVASPATAAVVLMPGLTRDVSKLQQIAIPPNVERVRIDALVEMEGEWHDLRASLRTEEGRESWSAAGLSLDAARTVRVAVPASELTTGEHTLIVTSGVEVVGEYFFFVTR